MANVLFRNPPHPKLLQQLAKGLLEQNHHLTRAVRLWALLRWLYGDKGYTALPDSLKSTGTIIASTEFAQNA